MWIRVGHLMLNSPQHALQTLRSPRELPGRPAVDTEPVTRLARCESGTRVRQSRPHTPQNTHATTANPLPWKVVAVDDLRDATRQSLIGLSGGGSLWVFRRQPRTATTGIMPDLSFGQHLQHLCAE